MTVARAVVSAEKTAAERAIALLTSFCDGTQGEDHEDWDCDLFFELLDEMQGAVGLADPEWQTIANVLISLLTLLDWLLEHNYDDKFDALAALASLLHGSLS